MSALIWIILIAIAALLIYAATRPKTFRLERSTTIGTAPDSVLELIGDFRNWPRWSPWEKLDPDLKRTYSGAESGVGSVYDWAGNNKAGVGRMQITEASPSRVMIDLDFLKPFKASNKTEFTLAPSDGGTRVSWAMFGPQPFLMRMMGIFMNAEKMIGPQFEEGLANLKREAEQKRLN